MVDESKKKKKKKKKTMWGQLYRVSSQQAYHSPSPRNGNLSEGSVSSFSWALEKLAYERWCKHI
jgi:hypothetical protein